MTSMEGDRTGFNLGSVKEILIKRAMIVLMALVIIAFALGNENFISTPNMEAILFPPPRSPSLPLGRPW